MSKLIIFVAIPVPGEMLIEKWIKSETEHVKVSLPRANRVCHEN